MALNTLKKWAFNTERTNRCLIIRSESTLPYKVVVQVTQTKEREVEVISSISILTITLITHKPTFICSNQTSQPCLTTQFKLFLRVHNWSKTWLKALTERPKPQWSETAKWLASTPAQPSHMFQTYLPIWLPLNSPSHLQLWKRSSEEPFHIAIRVWDQPRRLRREWGAWILQMLWNSSNITTNKWTLKWVTKLAPSPTPTSTFQTSIKVTWHPISIRCPLIRRKQVRKMLWWNSNSKDNILRIKAILWFSNNTLETQSQLMSQIWLRPKATEDTPQFWKVNIKTNKWYLLTRTNNKRWPNDLRNHLTSTKTIRRARRLHNLADNKPQITSKKSNLLVLSHQLEPSKMEALAVGSSRQIWIWWNKVRLIILIRNSLMLVKLVEITIVPTLLKAAKPFKEIK